MEFTCIECEHKFHYTLIDTDERICYECLEKTDSEDDDYEPTTADEYNKDYIKERIKGSRDGYWEPRS